MLRGILVLVCWYAYVLSGTAHAQPRELWAQTLNVDWDGTTVAIPVTVTGELSDEHQELTIVARAGLAALLPQIGSALEQAVDERHRGCRERWDGWNGAAAVDGRYLAARVTVRVEKWVCEGPLETRLGRETATLIGSFEPQVKDGRLVLVLANFRTQGLSTLSRELGVEDIIRGALQREIDKINSDDTLTVLPRSLKDEGFAYQAITLEEAEGGKGVVTLRAPADPIKVMRALSGLIQE